MGQWIVIQDALDHFPSITNVQYQQLCKQIEMVKPITCQQLEQLIMLSILYYSIQRKRSKNVEILLNQLKQFQLMYQKLSNNKSPQLLHVASTVESLLKEISDIIDSGKQIDADQKLGYFLDLRCLNLFSNLYQFITNLDDRSNRIQFICRVFQINLKIHHIMNNNKTEITSYQSLKPEFQIDIMNYNNRYFFVQPSLSFQSQIHNINSPSSHQNNINSPTIRNPTIVKTSQNNAQDQNRKPLPSSFSTESSRQIPNQGNNQDRGGLVIQGNQVSLGSIRNNNNNNNSNNNYNNQYNSLSNNYGLNQSQQQQNQIYNNSPLKNQQQAQNQQNYQQQSPEKGNQQNSCSVCYNNVTNSQKIYINEICGHRICYSCALKRTYPDKEIIDCFRKGCIYHINVSNMEIFFTKDKLNEISQTVKAFEISCSYCYMVSNIELDRKPEYFKCKSCSNVSCLLHQKPRKLDQCFCKCQKCLSETKQYGKMRVCEKCRISKCLRCNITYQNIYNCGCGCHICRRPLSLMQDGKSEICQCTLQTCSSCLDNLDSTTISDLNSLCPHLLCHPCFIQSQISQDKIKCILCYPL